MLIGCSAAIGLVAFVVFFTITLFVDKISWKDRMAMAATTATGVAVAALLLFMRDSYRHSSTMRFVRSQLLACNDTSDEHFVSALPTDNATLLLETRKAIAGFFNVPDVKVSRDLCLIDDLHVDRLEPAFQLYVVDSVVSSQPIERRPFGFSMAGLNSIDDLALAIKKVLAGFDTQSL